MTIEVVPCLAPLLAASDLDLVTREIFGNIPQSSKILFYAAATIALGIFSWGCWRKARMWRGGGRLEWPPWKPLLTRLITDVLGQRRLGRRGWISVAHRLLFYGFLLLLIGTCLIAVEHVLAGALGRPHDQPVFHKGLYYACYEVTLELAGIAFLVGVVAFAWRRGQRPASLDHTPADWLVLTCLWLIGVTGYLVEGLRILHAQTPHPGFSFVGLATAHAWHRLSLSSEMVANAHFALWWMHAVLALSLIAAVPFTRLWHSVAGMLNIALHTTELGALKPVSLEELEEKGFVGVGQITDFTLPQLTMLDACVACGRCEEACPAHEAGKPLSPKRLVQDLCQELHKGSLASSADGKTESTSLHADTVHAETLWSCTTCSACADVCPLRVSPVDLITDLRRYLISEAELRGAPATALQKTQRNGNPWGLAADTRFDWAAGLQVPTVQDCPDFDVLYWVGCAASYDRRAQRIARSMVLLMQAANVRFAVLGTAERCTGECARRMGDEFLFQELAEQNLATLQQHQVRKIVTHCPHCMNSLSKDYAQFGGSFDVVHHSLFLQNLMRDGSLPNPARQDRRSGSITYHDPCYLARVNGITQEPRELVNSVLVPEDESSLVEMQRHGRDTACCGAGGGRMWFDDTPEDRIGMSRANEAVETHAQTIAVSCPFCLTMMSDGVNAIGGQAQVKDISELLAESLALIPEK